MQALLTDKSVFLCGRAGLVLLSNFFLIRLLSQTTPANPANLITPPATPANPTPQPPIPLFLKFLPDFFLNYPFFNFLFKFSNVFKTTITNVFLNVVLLVLVLRTAGCCVNEVLLVLL